jgi:hypothetical protein
MPAIVAFNPYEHYGPNLTNSATRMFSITPSDTDELARVCKSIRIWNPDTVSHTVSFVTSGGDTVTVTVPANSVWTEPAVVKKVLTTGTNGLLVIHGYSD